MPVADHLACFNGLISGCVWGTSPNNITRSPLDDSFQVKPQTKEMLELSSAQESLTITGSTLPLAALRPAGLASQVEAMLPRSGVELTIACIYPTSDATPTPMCFAGLSRVWQS